MATELLDEQDFALLHDCQGCMLKPVAEKQLEDEVGASVGAYMDVILANDPAEYQEFAKDLFETGMLSVIEKRPKTLITPFFVRKRGKPQMRLVWDRRRLNALFREPPSVSMPSGITWSKIEFDAYDKLHIAQCDVKDCFYNIGVEEGLSNKVCVAAST